MWETLNNPDFNRVEFDPLLSESGKNSFTMSPTRWANEFHAIGIKTKATINKKEKGINEISYDKLILLIKKYAVEMNELVDNNNKESFSPSNEESIICIKIGICTHLVNIDTFVNSRVFLFYR